MKFRVELAGNAINRLPLRRLRFQRQIALILLKRRRAIVEELVSDDGAIEQGGSVIGLNAQCGLELAVGLSVVPALHPHKAQAI